MRGQRLAGRWLTLAGPVAGVGRSGRQDLGGVGRGGGSNDTTVSLLGVFDVCDLVLLVSVADHLVTAAAVSNITGRSISRTWYLGRLRGLGESRKVWAAFTGPARVW